MVIAHCMIGRPNFLGGPVRERGGNLAPYGDILQISTPELPFFIKTSRIASARFTPNASFRHWETIGRLGELILMLENFIK